MCFPGRPVLQTSLKVHHQPGFNVKVNQQFLDATGRYPPIMSWSSFVNTDGSSGFYLADDSACQDPPNPPAASFQLPLEEDGLFLDTEDVQSMSTWSDASEHYFDLEDMEVWPLNAVGANSASGFVLEEEPGSVEKQWKPGLDMGDAVGRLGVGLGNISGQSQMVLANLYFSLRRLPVGLVKQLCEQLLPTNQKVAKPWAAEAAARLSRVAANTIRAVVAKLRARSWAVVEPSSKRQADLQECSTSQQRNPTRIMNHLVEEVISHAYEGGSDLELFRRLQRLEAHGIDLGDEYHSTECFQLIEYLAGQAKQLMDSENLLADLGGLGIPSRFSVIFDCVSLGSTSFSRHETLLVTGLSHVSHHSGHLQSILIGAPSAGLSHSGQAQADKVVGALASHPARLCADLCSRRLMAIGGDGAVAQGGPESRHSSTRAGSMVWQTFRAGEPEFLIWDMFHREDICRKRAFRSVPLCVELFDVSAAMAQLYGTGQGRIVFRSTAAHIDCKALAVPALSGTRPTVSEPGAPGRLYANFRAYAASMH